MHAFARPHWRSAAADTFALVVYCFIAGMAIEVLISGMSFQQSTLFAPAVDPGQHPDRLALGRYRDLFIRTARRCPRGQFLLRNLADLLAYVSFQSPVYAAILWSVAPTQ